MDEVVYVTRSYARHGTLQEFARDIREDLKNTEMYGQDKPICSLMITHLNETKHCVVCRYGTDIVSIE